MKSKFQIENPGDVEVTMQITMRLKDWMTLKDQLVSSYPS